MALDLSKLRARVHARTAYRPKARGAKRGASRSPPPDPVVKKQEAQRALFEAAEARRKARIVKWTNTHPEVARYLRVLNDELTEARVETPGLVDVDLHYVIRTLKLHRLDHDVRVGLLTETQQWIKAVHKRRTRSVDITPYDHLFDPEFVDSLSEARTALKLH